MLVTISRTRLLCFAESLHLRCTPSLHSSRGYSKKGQDSNEINNEGSEKKRKDLLLSLPKTKLTLTLRDGAAAKREKVIQEKTGFSKLYEWQRNQKQRPEFVLHDGPPYANGLLHVGHAVNKILKDIVNRHKLLEGYRIGYCPGWDCHGLPIELKAIKQKDNAVNDLRPLTIRNRARNFAKGAIKQQKATFKRWGILGDWNTPYLTMDPKYSSCQLNVFYSLYKKGLIYQDFMPVYWSPSSRTALAESELIYNAKHVSQSLWLTFDARTIPESLVQLSEGKILKKPVKLLVWTTTPWTIPANQAICFGADIKYCCVETADTMYICCEEFVPTLKDILASPAEVTLTFEGSELSSMTYCHPLNNEELPVYSASHVTSTKGTGLVHTAPAHGHDDFHIAIDHGLSVKSLIREDGSYSPEAGPQLANKVVGKDANETVLELLGDHVIKVEDFVHSYPYDWRTNQPVIIRASLQWFMDTSSVKETAIKCLDSVNIYPKSSQNSMLSQLESRTYWCISRQRSWGLPIPVFYCRSTGKPFITVDSVNHISKLFLEHGTDVWWKMSTEELLPESVLQKSGIKNSSGFVKGEDILDIWFDSGVSWACILQDSNEEADVYLEGLDQFGGWFLSSLLTSVALNEKPPFKSLVVHGFTVDADGKKMSKSVGNVIDPMDVVDGSKASGIPSYGADVLRWWVATSGLQSNIPIGSSILTRCNEEVFRLRKTCRFLLGNLWDFTPDKDSVSYNQLLAQDSYMLHLLHDFALKAIQLYADHRYNKVTSIVDRFISADVSSFYSSIIKDRCYCDSRDSLARRSCQTVQYNILDVLIRLLAPILPHFAEEVFQYLPKLQHQQDCNSLFKTKGHNINPEWEDLAGYHSFQPSLQIKARFNEMIGPETPSSFDVIIWASGDLYNNLKVLQPTYVSTNSALVEILQASQVSLSNQRLDSAMDDVELVTASCSLYKPDSDATEKHDYVMGVLPCQLYMCTRCRRSVAKSSALRFCSRCADVIAEDYQ
ncbi:isoleucine--tRNA ligase, mitochondrial [Octopus sinensis]|uniref:isoleucine--tRNA ligase n=1 Tax=Octopus sinensis TaxID=2607531 RepID=A0A6P7TNG3_9MOLL|nr:isoleucine--tRNA ligase, mitochondrial [Octopus sinensis]